MNPIRLNDTTIVTFEKTLVALGFTRTVHSYQSNTMFDVWTDKQGRVFHVDQVRSAGNVYVATLRGSDEK